MNELVSTLALMPETKREQDVFVDKLVESVKQGAISPLKAEAIICNLEQVSKAYRANPEVRDMLLQAVQFKGGKCEDFNGFALYAFATCSRLQIIASAFSGEIAPPFTLSTSLYTNTSCCCFVSGISASVDTNSLLISYCIFLSVRKFLLFVRRLARPLLRTNAVFCSNLTPLRC